MMNKELVQLIFREPRAQRNHKYGNPAYKQFCEHAYHNFPVMNLGKYTVLNLIKEFGDTLNVDANDYNYNYFHQFHDCTVDQGEEAEGLIKFLRENDLNIKVQYDSWRWDRSTKPATCIKRVRIWVYPPDKENPNWRIYDIMYETIKADLLEARKTKSKNTSILQVLVGEIQLVESRQNTALSNEEIIAIIKKLNKSCVETFEKSGCTTALHESHVLSNYLPQTATQEQILEALEKTELYTEILSADVPAKLIGRANALLKELGIVAEGIDVAQVVKGIK